MPLKTGKSKKVRSDNISELIHSGYPTKQAVAIEYSRERKSERKKGKAPKKK